LAETSVAQVISARRTTLVRASDLRSFQRVIVEAACAAASIDEVRARAVVVPTRAAAAALRRNMEDARLSGGARARQAIALPMLVTRAELYAALHERIGGDPPLLSDFEREALLRRAAREVEAGGLPPPFKLRPGLIVEILRFYDQLRRRQRTVGDFDRLLSDTLSVAADYDRGAERLLRQTRFLTETFHRYESSLGSSGALDEHGLRRELLARPPLRPLTHVIVSVGDDAMEDGGLWPADFALLAQLAGLERLDVVATEEQLAVGWHQRVHDLLPGIEETLAPADERPAPVLVAPAGERASLFFTARDREEELVEIARLLKARAPTAGRFSVVFQRPLPYLYLARQVFATSGVSYEASDALPLAAEPFAAALDALFECLTSDYTRTALVDLLALPQFGFGDGRRRLPSREISALNRLLLEAKYLGGLDALRRVADHPRALKSGSRGLAAAIHVATELQEVAEEDRASAQFGRLVAFVRRHERVPHATAPWRERHLRARAAILAALEGLGGAHARFDDAAVSAAEMTAAVRRWVEGQTFSPRAGTQGVRLLDVETARFESTDELRAVGVVERDWPLRVPRNIFYPGGLLTQLGWPAEPARLASARAAFRDLLRLPTRRVSVSTFSLEDDALVAPSTFTEELDSLGLRVERPPAPAPRRIFVHEALAVTPVLAAVSGTAAEWLLLRQAEEAMRETRARGAAGPQAVDTFAVSHIERYLECPFKYFAAHVLRLDDEREEETGMTVIERGQFLHDLLMEFFKRWQAAGRGAIAADNTAEALALFRSLAEERLVTLSPLDRALEEGRLLGSAAAAGLAERLFAFELERDVPIVERLLEHRLEGEYTFKAGERERRIGIRAQADRIDLLADGTLRIIDYKLNRAPKLSRALQLPIYGVCATQHLEGHAGRSWRVGEAGYVAFGEREVFRPLAAAGEMATALAQGQQRLLDAVEGIERGEFPVRPDEPYLCTYCSYAGVCRKDYVGDE
jgi:RecB family exonuclease